MTNRLRDLSDLVSATRSKHARALEADLVRLRTQYGSVAINQADALAEQRDLRQSLSISGQRVRQRQTRESDRLAAAVFRTKPHDE